MFDPINIVIDIGGTHARIGQASSSYALSHIQKYKTTDWESFETLFLHYIGEHRLAPSQISSLAIATAVRPQIINNKRMIAFDQSYKNTGWCIEMDDLGKRLNLLPSCAIHFALDTEAQCLALSSDQRGDLCSLLYEPADEPAGKAQSNQQLLISLGTGLGHAYGDFKHPENLTLTFGGHMPPSAVTDQQRNFLQHIETKMQRENVQRHIIFEDIVSGRGYQDMVDFMDGDASKAATLLSEFLGLYLNIIATASHSFGGVYLVGGGLRDLYTQNLLDIPALKSHFILNMVPIVDQTLKSCPIYLVTESHLALHGLARTINA